MGGKELTVRQGQEQVRVYGLPTPEAVGPGPWDRNKTRTSPVATVTLVLRSGTLSGDKIILSEKQSEPELCWGVQGHREVGTGVSETQGQQLRSL